MASMSLIVFSGDYDRSMAAFTLANGAAGEGDQVTMFFTFWGLCLLRRVNGPAPGFLQRAFKRLMPVGPNRLPLTRMNFCGLGPRLMRKLIRQQDGQSLQDLLQMSLARGVDLVACEASMKLLGMKREELLFTDRLRVGDVHAFLEAARKAEVCLFV
jgi:peroxiredoxin family protein